MSLMLFMGEPKKEGMKSMLSEGLMCVGISSQLGASKSSQDEGKKLFWMGWASNDDDSPWWRELLVGFVCEDSESTFMLEYYHTYKG
jgi:hypothetical protein